ncbi:amidohydrolase family protein [Roseisolibacter sp. H3M3-2]|uniref:amidohydrolase family protein n=1 Tax=Roseisolibacter sp. H3M3-2 TaxID=3031323 RepID=UPI0023DBE41E|nr:amidohydrolase family protein [Roseisolibacter sp. H3M3-2]MDF1503751.1 amidohydrolase family protein [Roseisolibacter sp. H3M3-2]
MRGLRIGTAAALAWATAAGAQTGDGRPGAALAVTGVHVVPMTADTVLRDHTVLVRDGRVTAVGPSAAVRVPAGTRVVDGRGKWLVPGLADMHTHLFSDDATPDSLAADELGVMVANGVTTARLMIGTPEHLALRRDVAAGRVLGPRLRVASPQLTGREAANARVVTTPEQARAAVAEAAAAGFDCVKLTSGLTLPAYEAIVDEAARRRIRVVGHVEDPVPLARALRKGQQLEHLDGYLEAALGRPSLTQGGVFRLDRWPTLDALEDRTLDSLAGATARAGAWIGPTLAVFNSAFGTGQDSAEVRARPDFVLWPAAPRALYLRAEARYWTAANAEVRTEARRRRYVAARNRLVKAIADSGGRILAGSDTPEWFHVYGFGLHRELQALVAAGLTPYQALAAATRAPAEYLGEAAEWGTIAAGRRADLVLLDGDPRADVRNTTRIAGVAVGGRWLPRAELEAMVAKATRRVGGGA